MTDATARIKNLSIALEAVSRLNMPALGDTIYVLLTKEVKKFAEKKGLTDKARPANDVSDFPPSY